MKRYAGTPIPRSCRRSMGPCLRATPRKRDHAREITPATAGPRQWTSHRLQADLRIVLRGLPPQPFDIVELADLGPEHVQDHLAGIDQHPIAIGHALDMQLLAPGLLETLGHVLGDRADMAV